MSKADSSLPVDTDFWSDTDNGTAGPSVDREDWLFVGAEKRTEPNYYWHGLRRGASADHPFVVLQYTVAGAGAYEEQGVVTPVGPGTLMVAAMPSDHAYYLPPDAPDWQFVWLILRHPYAARRIAAAQSKLGAVVTLGDDGGPVLTRILDLIRATRAQSFRDVWALEQGLLDLAVEYDRLVERRLYPQDMRERVLADVRDMVLASEGRRLDVEEVASMRGMSRSAFSHWFKAATGIPPAQWITQVAMDEAVRLLLTGDLKLEAVARQTGFADANHFCKSFRRRFHTSPGEFRRQMR